MVLARRVPPRATSIPRARWPANRVFCCAFALWRGCPIPASAWPDHAKNGCRSNDAACQETPGQSSSRTHLACPTSTTAPDAPGVWPNHALSQSAGEFRWSRSTKVLRQTTPVADPIPSPRRAFRVLSLAASRQSKASRDASSGTPFSTEQDLVDALPTCIDSVADSPRSRLPTKEIPKRSSNSARSCGTDQCRAKRR